MTFQLSISAQFCNTLYNLIGLTVYYGANVCQHSIQINMAFPFIVECIQYIILCNKLTKGRRFIIDKLL